MTSLALLIDNDVVIKLAQMGVYGDAISALDVSTSEVGSLGYMLRYMGKESSEKREFFMGSAEGANQLSTILKGISEIEPTQEEVSTAARIMRCALLGDLDLDEGEVGLIAIALHRQAPDIATGDKRAVRALPAASKSEAMLAKLKGRVICFEQVIGRFCIRYGIDRVKSAVLFAPHADQTVTRAFQEVGAKGAHVFVQLLDFLTAEQVVKLAPGWLKIYGK